MKFVSYELNKKRVVLNMFDNLDDQEMLEAYDKAIKLNLEIDFICILKEELEARGLLIQIKGYK